MGLFGRKSKESDEERYNRLVSEAMNTISAHNFLISLDYAIGEYGNDDVVAGSMIGETGKLIAMSKYGDVKWGSTTIQLHTDGVQIHYNGVGILYSDILKMEWVKPRMSNQKELIIHSRHGDYIFRSEQVFMDAVINYINAFKDRYMGWINDGLIVPGEDLSAEEFQALIDGTYTPKSQKDTGEVASNTDRLLRAAELFERGLLSEDEFNELKKKLI